MEENGTFVNGSFSSSFSIDYELFRQMVNGSLELFPNRSGLPENYSFWQEEGTYGSWEGGSAYPSGYSHLGLILTSFFVTVIMILIVVGNMLVCIAIATEKALKTVQNWFIASLAVSDFLVGLIIMPFSLAREVMGYWIFGRIWCEIHSALDVFLCTASINSLCLISLDRYWSVTHAVEYLRQRTPRRSLAMICGVWVLSAVISLPPLVGWRKPDRSTANYPECLLSDDVGYVLYSAFGSFYIPAFVMVFVYARIFVAARSRARRHLKKKQKIAAVSTCQELTTNKSTTTTTCTSFSNASPPSRDPEPLGVLPRLPEPLPKIPEANGAHEASPVVVVDAPEIVVSGGDGNATEGIECESSSSPEPRSGVTFNLDSPGASKDPDAKEQRHLVDLARNEKNLLVDSSKSHLVDLARTERSHIDMSRNSPSEKSLLVEPSTISEKSHLVVCAQHCRRTSLLRAPKFLRSPFGSTMSLAEMGGSEEDVSDSGRRKNNKKKVKTKTVSEEIPKRTTTSDAERHKRRIAKAKERRATLILGLIMASFILAWLPFFVLYVLEALCGTCHIGSTGFAIAFWLGYCNSALNPIIYTIFNRDFRKAFRKILFK